MNQQGQLVKGTDFIADNVTTIWQKLVTKRIGFLTVVIA